MLIDLHAHSSVSDGTDSPTALLEAAARADVDVLALADHDTTQGLAEARRAGSRVGVDLVPAIELSTTWRDADVHLLVYWPDEDDEALQSMLATIRDGRRRRIPRMLARLAAHGIDVSEQDVRRVAGGAASLGRPHVADALVAAGIVGSRGEAFDTWIGEGMPGHVSKPAPTLRDAIFVFLLSSCGSKTKGELVGAEGRKWYPEKPYGMELIPRGAFIMGKSEEDQAKLLNAPTKTVTVRSFYMDDTEITNSEYRQFVEWVKDSITRTKLAVLADELGIGPEEGGIGDYAFKDADTTRLSAYDKYMLDNYAGMGDNYYEGRALNKDEQLIWDISEYPDEYYTEIMDSMYISEDQSYNGQRSIDVTKLKYKYSWMDIDAAARAKTGSRKDFIRQEELNIYPDTTVWIRDFQYSYNEPMHNDYFWHDAYSEYPVVGISWAQARAFCNWRTKFKNDDQKSRGKQFVNQFRLPTEAEWEYAARGGIESGTYPWGGPYVISDTGCFMANFKPQRGDYAADAALYTVEAKSYEPNDFNLYNMAGNVSEWTNSSYDPASYDFVSTMNPNGGDGSNERKVIRGGSWKDVAYFLQVSTRDYEYADSARSYIGFRTVQDYMGEEDSTQ